MVFQQIRDRGRQRGGVKREILKALEAGELSAAGLGSVLRRGSGAIYPALAGLEEEGRIVSRWEPPEPPADDSPRRQLYALLEPGEPASEPTSEA